MADTDPPVTKASMHVPSMDEVILVLNDGLKKNFDNVNVSVVDCPDLTKKPFMLASEGLCGNPRLADVGGGRYVVPIAQKDKVYNFAQIAKLTELPEALMIGAGAGPHHHVGVNSELMNNVKLDKSGSMVRNNAFTAKVNLQDGSCMLEKLHSSEFSLLGKFLCSEGKSGKVIEIKASKRTGTETFMSNIRGTLDRHYGKQPIALGGVFLLEKGKAGIQIMPDFSSTPLSSLEEINKWKKHYEMDAPLVCVGGLVTRDLGIDLLLEHFHCYSEHGQGGHFSQDITPNEAEYRGYFVLADYVYRIDRPPA